MATFASVQKHKLSWQAPPTVVAPDIFLLVATGFYLNIGSGYKLIIDKGQTTVPWTNINKTR